MLLREAYSRPWLSESRSTARVNNWRATIRQRGLEAWPEFLFLGEQDDFAGDLGLLEELICAGGFAERKLCGDDRLELAIGEKIEEFGEVFAEPVGVLVAEIFYVVPEGVFAVGNKF